MKVSLKDGFEYIPEWNGNKKLPENEQIKVFMHFVTGLDITDCILDGRIDPKKDWLCMCQSIDNLYLDDAGKVKATPEDICTKGGFSGLYLELKAAYRDETAINKKK